MRNAGIVFSPTLGIPAGVFSLMLGEFNRVFNVDADNDNVGGQEDSNGCAVIVASIGVQLLINSSGFQVVA